MNGRVLIGARGEWHWVSVLSNLSILGGLLEELPELFDGRTVVVSAFDSGSLRLTPQEIALGWQQYGRFAIYGPLNASSLIPSDNFDEWYIFDRKEDARFPNAEPFVNNCAFHLANPVDVHSPWDATWEPPDKAHAGLLDSQEMFWQEMARVQPSVYMAEGDNFVLASRRRDEVARTAETAVRILG